VAGALQDRETAWARVVQCCFDLVVSKSTPWLILSIAARAAGGRMIVRSERPSSIVRSEPQSLKRIC